MTELPLRADRLRTSVRALDCSHGVAPHPVDLERIGVLLELSVGLSAWKRYRSTRWALRCNPSSGNLHPTEGYLVCGRLPGLEPGVHHYVSHDHVLEQRAGCDREAWSDLFEGGVVLALTSVFWREAWKYGVRAFRYCQHDVGHAIAAVRYAAAALGWRAKLIDGWGDDDLARLLGIHRPADFHGAEHESPDALLWIGPRERTVDPEVVLPAMGMPRWFGRASRLSPKRIEWPPIDEVEKAARKRRTTFTERPTGERPPRASPSGDMGASRLFRQRRSAVDLDGRTSISKQAFYTMLDALLPRRGVAPWDALPWEPRVHPVFFVHRVEGLRPGLYALPRRPEALPELRAAMRSELLWERVDGPAAHVDLRLLVPIDCREAAATIACGQAIAADGAFAVGMLAEFERSLTEGTWWYRHLHWEAGVLGHVLYLEAERAGVRGTGIGCFFDDTMHDTLGLSDWSFQTLYHFTVGGPLDDPRLQTEPAYEHLASR